jgi:hypothetical protein
MLYHLIAKDEITGAALEWEIASVTDDEIIACCGTQVLE